MCRDLRREEDEDAVYPPTTEPSLVPCRCDHTPIGSCGVRREHKRLHRQRRASRSAHLAGEVPSSCHCPLYSFVASCDNFLPLPLLDVYNGHTDTELFIETRYPREMAPMNEPTQELIVSELRRRVRVSIADLTQVLGLQFASMLPQEIQRMKDSGFVVYDEPLGPSSVLSLPQ